MINGEDDHYTEETKIIFKNFMISDTKPVQKIVFLSFPNKRREHDKKLFMKKYFMEDYAINDKTLPGFEKKIMKLKELKDAVGKIIIENYPMY